jgi:hypothetical protein
VTAASFYQNGASLHSNGSRQTDGHDSLARQSEPSKPKRAVPLSIPARLTRSKSSKMNPPWYRSQGQRKGNTRR